MTAAPSRTLRLRINKGRALLPGQHALLTNKPNAETRVLVGGYGSGKTLGGALSFLANCLANPWEPNLYEDGDHPTSIVVGMTAKVLRDSQQRELRRVTPSEIIRQEWQSPERKWLLANGHLVQFLTWAGAIEGNTVCGLWLDEASKLRSALQLQNLLARVRDNRARSRRTIITGLPEAGLLQETFQPLEGSPSHLVVHARTQDNTYLPAGYVEQLRASISRREAAAYFEGEWMPTIGAALYEYDQSVHLVDDPGNRQQPVHVSLDVGNRGAVLFLQERERKVRDQKGNITKAFGLHVVDELLPENMDVETVGRMIAQRGWLLVPGKSLLLIDPNSDADEINGLRKSFPCPDPARPHVAIVKKKRGESSYLVEYGLRTINAALRDADGNVKLTIYRGLPRHERSLLTAMPKYRIDDVKRTAIKDGRTDHVIDALRYAVAHLLPLKDVGIIVRNLAA